MRREGNDAAEREIDLLEPERIHRVAPQIALAPVLRRHKGRGIDAGATGIRIVVEEHGLTGDNVRPEEEQTVAKITHVARRDRWSAAQREHRVDAPVGQYRPEQLPAMDRRDREATSGAERMPDVEIRVAAALRQRLRVLIGQEE